MHTCIYIHIHTYTFRVFFVKKTTHDGLIVYYLKYTYTYTDLYTYTYTYIETNRLTDSLLSLILDVGLILFKFVCKKTTPCIWTDTLLFSNTHTHTQIDAYTYTDRRILIHIHIYIHIHIHIHIDSLLSLILDVGLILFKFVCK